jgi:enterochelin esterase-like enzyme
VARATPEGYREEARLAALGHSSFTWPSFAGGRVFLRNDEELVCVEVLDAAVPLAGAEPGPAGPAAAAPAASGGGFEAFLASLAGSSDAQAAVDAYTAACERFPIVEGDRVHFLFQGEVEDVAVGGPMIPGGSEPLARVAGTDLHTRSYALEPGSRWEYRFQVDYERWIPDPRNPSTVPAAWGGEASELLMPGYRDEAHHREPAEGTPRGTLETYEFTSATLGGPRPITVYLPAGYAQSEERYPLVVVHGGPDYLEKGGLAHTLDHLIGARVRPLVAAFVTPADLWWHEAGGTGTEEYLAVLARELVPDLAARYRLLPGPGSCALLAQRSFALSSALGALLYPDVFGKVALQSALLDDVARHALFARIADEPLEPVAFHVEWSRHEGRDADGGFDPAADGRRLFDALSERGYAITGGEVLDTAGWGGWRRRTDDLLEALFPLQGASGGVVR